MQYCKRLWPATIIESLAATNFKLGGEIRGEKRAYWQIAWCIVWGREDDWRDTDRRFVFGQVGDERDRETIIWIRRRSTEIFSA